MIDFVKAVITGCSIEKLANNKLLHFKSEFSEKTGVISPKRIASYKGLKFIINHKRVSIEGSLHKYQNNGFHNYDSFTYSQLCEVLQDLELLLATPLDAMKLENIEFGVNIDPLYSTTRILSSLLFHCQKPFKEIAFKKGDYRLVLHDRYSIKAYDKALQFNLNEKILRFEIHCNKMKQIEHTGISQLSHLLDTSKLYALQRVLLKRWDEVFFYDWTIDKQKALTKIDIEQYYQMQNTSYWLGMNRRKRYKQRVKYTEKLVHPFSKNIHKRIGEIIRTKSNYLINN